MSELTKNDMLRIVEENINRLKNKDFNVYFFVLDSKGNPTSALEYIYKTAYTLYEKGYKVGMLHQEKKKEFIGVSSWLGEKYNSLPHYNIDKDNVEITASDFVFIPEIFANVMIQTKKLPCKRVIIVQNCDNICEFMPASHDLNTVNITDAIVTTKEQEKKLLDFFPNVRTHIVNPSIKNVFRPNDKQRKLVINVISKEQSVINQIIKPFYWKNPMYKWVSFNDLRGLPQDVFAEALREGAITIWVDDTTSFGYTALEALKCGSIVVGKIPGKLTEWMIKDNSLTNSVLWFNTIDEIVEILPNLVRSWTIDAIPKDVYDSIKTFDDEYTEEKQKEQIEKSYEKELFERRLKEFEETKVEVENNNIKPKEK